MITFEGDKYDFEVFSYLLDDPLRHINMGRIHFKISPIGIAYIEGILIETEREVTTDKITSMTIGNIYRIVFKDGNEVISKDIKDCEESFAIPATDINSRIWNEGMSR